MLFPQAVCEQQLYYIIPHFSKGRKASELILKKINFQVGLPEKLLSFVITDLILDSDPRLGIEEYFGTRPLDSRFMQRFTRNNNGEESKALPQTCEDNPQDDEFN